MQGFEWDQEKAQGNLGKHDVGFEEAGTALLDPMSLTVFDFTHSVAEDRWLTIGYSQALRLLLVVTTERDKATRIISARKANPNERKIYEQHNR